MGRFQQITKRVATVIGSYLVAQVANAVNAALGPITRTDSVGQSLSLRRRFHGSAG